MAESITEDTANLNVDDDETSPNYKPPAPKSTSEILSQDADDESLVSYKKALMGEGGDPGASPADDPRKVIVAKMQLLCDGRDPVEMDLSDLKSVKDGKHFVKEGTSYKLKVIFYIHHEIVCGLRLVNEVKRKGVKVNKSTYMFGSYGPKSELQEAVTKDADEFPSGALFRGEYKVNSKFIDDDKQVHLEWDWSFDIKKEWKD